MSDDTFPYPRVRNLPKEEREPFMDWLCGQTRPANSKLPMTAEDQDYYYPWDYERWKAKLPIID